MPDRFILCITRRSLYVPGSATFPPVSPADRSVSPSQDSLRDIAAQTQCVELIICERLSRLRTNLADIVTLEDACLRAQHRLQPGDEAGGEDAALAAYLQELRQEKRRLASALPRLAAGGALSASEDELLGPESRSGSQEDVSAASPPDSGAGTPASTPASTPAGTPAAAAPPPQGTHRARRDRNTGSDR